MKVRDIIKALQKLPQDLEGKVWDEDENMPIVQVLWEDGTSHVQFLTREEEVVSTPAEDVRTLTQLAEETTDPVMKQVIRRAAARVYGGTLAGMAQRIASYVTAARGAPVPPTIDQMMDTEFEMPPASQALADEISGGVLNPRALERLRQEEDHNVLKEYTVQLGLSVGSYPGTDIQVPLKRVPKGIKVKAVSADDAVEIFDSAMQALVDGHIDPIRKAVRQRG